MLSLVDVKFNNYQIKAQFASKDFPLERLWQLRDGMLGQNKVLTPRAIQTLVNERVRSSRIERYGLNVCNLFEIGGEPEYNVKGERVCASGLVMGMSVLYDSKMSEKFPDEVRGENVVSLSFGARGVYYDKGKGWGKGVPVITEEDDFLLPEMIATEGQRRVQLQYGLCTRCGQTGHDREGFNSEVCRVAPHVRCESCQRLGHHYKACPRLGFNRVRGTTAHEAYVRRFQESAGIV
jgi:hypothetical protein